MDFQPTFNIFGEYNFVVMKVFLVVVVFVAIGQAQEQQKMVFETPKLSEEEQHSQHTPGSFELQCDACSVIAYKVRNVFSFVFKNTV